MTLALLAAARPLLFATVLPEVAAARGVRTRALGIGFLVGLAVVVAQATQAVGALLLLGLLAPPAAAAQRIVRGPAASVALACGFALVAVWGGLALAYALPTLPPSSAIVGIAAAIYYATVLLT